jgi:stage V sporulation protein B
MKKNSLITGALILTAASLISRILGFIYRIYMSNVIGSEGIGLYQLIIPIYTLAWSISASGFSTTISKLVAQENAKKEYGNMGRILKQSVWITSLIGLILSLFLFLFANWIGLNILNDSRTILALKVLALCFPFMAAGSCIRGYFYGIQYSSIPAYSQVIEQMIRMFIIYILSEKLVPLGLEYACLAAIGGICMGEFISYIYVLVAYKRFKNKNRLNKKPSTNSLIILSSILAMATPLTANRVISSFLSAVENTLIPQKLIEYGYNSSQAMSEYGKITGMAMPLLQFPSAFLVALSISLVPAISESLAVKNKRRVNYTISKALQFTSLIGIAVTSIFLAFPYEISMSVYNSNEIGQMLYYLSWLSPFLYLHIILSGILNGLGEQMFIFKIHLLTSGISILFIYFYMPVYGMNAYIIGSILSFLAADYLSIHKILEKTTIIFEFANWLFKPILACAAATLTIKYLATAYLFNHLPLLLGVLVTLSLIGVLYILFLFLLKSLNKNDIMDLVKSVKKS